MVPCPLAASWLHLVLLECDSQQQMMPNVLFRYPFDIKTMIE